MQRPVVELAVSAVLETLDSSQNTLLKSGCFGGPLFKWMYLRRKSLCKKNEIRDGWNQENESAWDRVKAAFKRDWDRTKHDFGGDQLDTDQDVDDTVKQDAGKQPIPPRGQPTYEEVEDAYRFGYGARSHYGKKYAEWDDQLEARLLEDWRETYKDRDWVRYRDSIRRGWNYEDD